MSTSSGRLWFACVAAAAAAIGYCCLAWPCLWSWALAFFCSRFLVKASPPIILIPTPLLFILFETNRLYSWGSLSAISFLFFIFFSISSTIIFVLFTSYSKSCYFITAGICFLSFIFRAFPRWSDFISIPFTSFSKFSVNLTNWVFSGYSMTYFISFSLFFISLVFAFAYSKPSFGKTALNWSNSRGFC